MQRSGYKVTLNEQCFPVISNTTLSLVFSVESWKAVVLFVLLLLLLLKCQTRSAMLRTCSYPHRCRGKSGGHPGQQDVYLPPLLECSRSSSVQHEWEVSWTLCYLLLFRLDTEQIHYLHVSWVSAMFAWLWFKSQSTNYQPERHGNRLLMCTYWTVAYDFLSMFIQMWTPNQPESWSALWSQVTSSSCTPSTSCREVTLPWRQCSSCASCLQLCFRSEILLKVFIFKTTVYFKKKQRVFILETCATAVTMQVGILLYVASLMVRWLWSRGLDPDNFSIPYLTALGDLLGTGFLALSFRLIVMISSTQTGLWYKNIVLHILNALFPVCKTPKRTEKKEREDRWCYFYTHYHEKKNGILAKETYLVRGHSFTH